MSGDKSKLRHLGEREERCTTLCGARLDYDLASETNTELDEVTWSDDGSWIGEVTCPECLRLAIKLGHDAEHRLAELESGIKS